jgi:N6-L-threonylcarbamoyladenine synthase
MRGARSLEFSFSGLKTAVLLHLRDRCLPPLGEETLADIAASFQEAVVDVLVSKTLRAARRCKVKNIVVSGGVASNRKLRATMQSMGDLEGLEILFPSAMYCTDNAAMVARAGVTALQRTDAKVDLTMNAISRWPL